MMYLIAGPPCGGKTTFVRDRAQAGDTIIDYDDIVESLGGQRYTDDPLLRAKARDVWVSMLDSPHPQDTWVIWTAPRRTERGRFRGRRGAQVVVVMPPIEVCLERARAERPESWVGAIGDWFMQWEPSTSGQELILSGENEGAGS